MRNKYLFPEESINLITEVTKALQDTRKLWEHYKNTKKWKEQYFYDLANEVSKRLTQIELILNKIVEYEDISRLIGQKVLLFSLQKPTQVPSDLLNEESKITTEVELLTESFYYISFRMISTISLILDKLHIKKRSKGILFVRNLLIEHPEKTSQIYTLSFANISPTGPLIKNARSKNDKGVYQDPGLYLNIKEMLNEIKIGLNQ